jgi:hypothetical protein
MLFGGESAETKKSPAVRTMPVRREKNVPHLVNR